MAERTQILEYNRSEYGTPSLLTEFVLGININLSNYHTDFYTIYSALAKIGGLMGFFTSVYMFFYKFVRDKLFIRSIITHLRQYRPSTFANIDAKRMAKVSSSTGRGLPRWCEGFQEEARPRHRLDWRFSAEGIFFAF